MTQTVPQALLNLVFGTANATDILRRQDGDARFEPSGANTRFEPKGEYSDIRDFNGSVTLSAADKGALLRSTSATAHNLTVPPNSAVGFAVKTRIDGVQWAAGVTTITAGVGVTIRSAGNRLKSGGIYTGWTLTKVGTDEWVLIGEIAS